MLTHPRPAPRSEARLQSSACPLCDAPARDAIVVGLRGRFGMDVRNVCCRTCGLVRVDPYPTAEALAEYYREAYRQQYRSVKLPTADGRFVGPDDEGYLEARRERYRRQAEIAVKLGGLEPGDRVLEIGCRDGQTLAQMRATAGIEAYGVEPGVREASQAIVRGIDVFVGVLEELDLSDAGAAPAFPARVDQVQMFHVFEHLHDPLGVLAHVRRWLEPGGRLLLEVPNVTHPYGPLEANFFQNAHLTSFSANTLCGLLSRAGFTIERVVDGQTLFVLASRDPSLADEVLPLPFTPAMLPWPERTGAWVAERLDTYRLVERTKALVLEGDASMDRLSTFAALLQRPGFAGPTLSTLRQVVEYFQRLGAPRAGQLLARAAANGPHDADVRAACNALVPPRGSMPTPVNLRRTR